MKDVIKFGPVVFLILVGGAFVILGANGLLPFGNNPPLITDFFRWLLIILGLILLGWAIWGVTKLILSDYKSSIDTKNIAASDIKSLSNRPLA